MARITLAKHELPVLRACEIAHGHYTGSGDSLSDDEVRDLLVWLRRRIGEEWDASPPRSSAYDAAVRALAAQAIMDLVDSLSPSGPATFVKSTPD